MRWSTARPRAASPPRPAGFRSTLTGAAVLLASVRRSPGEFFRRIPLEIQPKRLSARGRGKHNGPVTLTEPHLMRFPCFATLLLLLAPALAQADLVTLYNDSAGNLPADQPWLVYADDSIFGGSVSQTATAYGVNLVTDNTVSAGYSNYIPLANTFRNPAFPALDRNQGFRLNFELQINSETHSSGDRAGFSVILLASDMRGIELGFWENEIWAQNDSPLFTHGEGTSFDTTLDEVEYELLISGNQYILSANGNPVLASGLRDYSAFGGPPYTLGSYLFLGDNTGSSGADISLGRVTLTTIPEPVTAWILVAPGIGLLLRRQPRVTCR